MKARLFFLYTHPRVTQPPTMLSLSHPRLDLPLVFRPHMCPGLCQGIKEESGSEKETIWRQEVIQRVLSDDPEMKGLGGGGQAWGHSEGLEPFQNTVCISRWERNKKRKLKKDTKGAVTSLQAMGLDRNKTAIGFQSAHWLLEVLWKRSPLPHPLQLSPL